MSIILTHIAEIFPYYLIFEIFYQSSKKIFMDFNHIYFLLHFIVNLINTILLIPLVKHLLSNPLGNNLIVSDWYNLDIIYPMIIGLHTFHLVHHIKNIKYDEIIHHIITHIFWYFIHILKNPLYIAGIITMSGIPGGITYLMLFLQKYNLVTKITEKKISMYLNIWFRAPVCIIFSTLLYIKSLENDMFYGTLFMCLFTMINGIHFMHNIIESYYYGLLGTSPARNLLGEGSLGTSPARNLLGEGSLGTSPARNLLGEGSKN